MRNTKTKIKAVGAETTISIQATLETADILTPDELRQKRKRLNDCLWDALRVWGFHHQDIKVS